MGISTPPSIKVVVGITTACPNLKTCYSLKRQCSIVILGGMLYLALKASIPSGASTKLANLTIFRKGESESENCKRRKGRILKLICKLKGTYKEIDRGHLGLLL